MGSELSRKEYLKIKQQECRARKRAGGFCIHCSRPTAPGRAMCDHCLWKYNNIKRVAAGKPKRDFQDYMQSRRPYKERKQ